MRGSAWRFFLALGSIPESWPAIGVASPADPCLAEAESPWFEYFNDLDPEDPEDAQFLDKDAALQKACDWFASVGLLWLEQADSMSPDEWRRRHNILVRLPH